MTEEIDCNSDKNAIQEKFGILIEYGYYNPNMCPEEKEYTDKGLVAYHYGDKGGLRYYGKKYSEFIKEFGNIGYINLNIDENNRKSFGYFINEIAKVEDNKWIQSKYVVSLTYNFNCQTFAIEALKLINPYFHLGDVNPADPELAKKKSRAKLGFIPENMKSELMKYLRK